jgi:hypothetical protein
MSGKSNYSRQIQTANIQRVKFGKKSKYHCVTALFDVINYIPDHSWWKSLPVKKGGYFIFDIFDKEKVDREGFKTTIKERGNIERYIRPLEYNGKIALLKIYLTGYDNQEFFTSEKHRIYVWSMKDIKRFCRGIFDIVEVKKTKKWQTWVKLRRK